MPVYWKPWHSLEDRKSFLQKIIQLSIIAFAGVIIIDLFLIYYFWTEPSKIIVWSIFALLIRRKDVTGIIEWLIEIKKMENNIDKGFLWEIKVAESLSKLASQNTKFCVFHDVFMWHENIDHIVVYDNRVIIGIETKSYSRFPYGIYLKKLNYQIRRQRNFYITRHDSTFIHFEFLQRHL